MRKHTTGPWGRNIAPASRYPIIFAGRNTHVARVITQGLPESEQEANADLIAAAPDLLAALEMAEGIVHNAVDSGKPVAAVLKHIRAAIAKATGQTP